MEFEKVADSGKRESFDTGSIRDVATGKGTPHLIVGYPLLHVLKGVVNTDYDSTKVDLLKSIEGHLLDFNTNVSHREDTFGSLSRASSQAFVVLLKLENNSYYHAMRRFAQHYENGAKKYSPNNWRKGQPVSRYYDSAMRHLWLLRDDDTTEDHAAALLWNLTCIIQTKADVQCGNLNEELNDFPFTLIDLFGKE